MKYLFPFVFALSFFSSSVFAELRTESTQAAVATAHPLATKAGVEILKKGGNAFDAAAAITASLAVVEPYSSGLGGGAFWLIHRASDNKQIMIDGREKAPMRADKDMYLDKSGNVIKGLSLNGPMAAGIPGVPAGIEHLTKKYGRLTLKENLAPAIKQAEEGFAVTERYQKLMGFRSKVVKNYPEAASLFLKENNIPSLGHVIVQKDLAKTLSLIASEGRDGFYKGARARLMVDSVKRNGGIWEMDDLANYNLVEREPIVVNYNGMRVTSATLPSSGGVVMGQALNILEHFDLNKLDSITRKHVVVEAMRRAYRDRAAYLGDMDFIDVPIDRLLDKNYTEGMAITIDVERATPSSELSDIVTQEHTGTDTTHFSVVDAEGNRVSATLSINLPFGSGFVAEGTGVLLNDEMDDFSVKPLTANAYGLVGDHANAIAPGKRPLSSMTPTFVETEDRIAILGTPGGSRIISMVLLGVLDFADGHLPKSWVSVPRYHHQYLPDEILFEQGGLTISEQTSLKNKGHKLNEKNRQYGNMQAIMVWKNKNISFAASDPRGEGSAEVIYLPK
jgi:gamma-glutamyltranspeptidase/glutathione hydrolase